MNDTIPTGKFRRTLSSGKIAARMGKDQVQYWLKQGFLSRDKKECARKKLAEQHAKTLFDGLAFLRGTALKAAQMLSFETEFFPEEFRKELEKSYHQVPPINRALIRKLIQNNFDLPPEKIFRQFEATAFAAASLGQVHHAVAPDGTRLAVKLQYPDIAKTIENDIRLLKTALYPMAEYDLIKTALDEIETVLLAETDYTKEAENIRFFKENLDLSGVGVPDVFPDLSTRQVLSMSLMPGTVLSQWLKTRPDRESRTRVAQSLNDIFIKGFYELGMIHADPNPGNFLVSEDLQVNLLDFGCIRRFDSRFIRMYKKMLRMGGKGSTGDFKAMLTEINLIRPDLEPDIQDRMADLFVEIGNWYSRLFREETFDFGANPDFMETGRKIGQKMHRFRKHIHRINPEFIFLDRTRYGLIRLFEKMGVRLRMRNQYEYCEV